MALRKCPRCELNYILDDGSLCTVCREEVHGIQDEPENAGLLCSVCGEAAVLPGQDICKACLAEMRTIEADVDDETGDDASLAPAGRAQDDDLDALDGMDEIDDLGEESLSIGKDDGEEDEETQVVLRDVAEA